MSESTRTLQLLWYITLQWTVAHPRCHVSHRATSIVTHKPQGYGTLAPHIAGTWCPNVTRGPLKYSTVCNWVRTVDNIWQNIKNGLKMIYATILMQQMLHFDSNFTELCFQWSNSRQTIRNFWRTGVNHPNKIIYAMPTKTGNCITKSLSFVSSLSWSTFQ